MSFYHLKKKHIYKNFNLQIYPQRKCSYYSFKILMGDITQQKSKSHHDDPNDPDFEISLNEFKFF